MKSITKFMLGGLAALSLAGAAQAQTYIYIAGSSAFRSQAHTAIMHAMGSLDGTTLPAASGSFGYVGTSGLGKGGSAIFSGTISGVTGQVIIKTTWTGSEAGLWSVAADSGTGGAVNFLPDSTAISSAGSNGASDPTNAANPHVSVIPDAAFSDTFQSTSQFKGGASILYYDGSLHTMGTVNEVTGGAVGVTYFVFVTSPQGTADGLTNITAEQAKLLFSGGTLPVSFINPGILTTSNSAGTIFAVGRDPDSGTRLSTLGEIGSGNLATVTQYQPYDSSNNLLSGGSGTVSYVKAVVSGTVNNVSVAAGNGGYNNGGNMTKALNSIDSSFRKNTTGGAVQPAGSCMIAYASVGDANNTTAGTKLAYNGVTPSDANVQNGSYPLWTYEHIYLNANTANSAAINTIATQLRTSDAAGTGCVLRTSMKVKRNGSLDGGATILAGTY